MRIIAGAWRGRTLAAPPGQSTRPTADRVRQALFDRLMHAPWAGRAAIEGATVLDAFAGTGALGLEALSRGAAHATFIERDKPAFATLRANIATCRATPNCTTLQADTLHPPPGTPCTIIFLDPPYNQDLLQPACIALQNANWIAPQALLITETARGESTPSLGSPLAHFESGPAQVTIFKAEDSSLRERVR